MANKQTRVLQKFRTGHHAGKRKNGGAGAFAEGAVAFIPVTKRWLARFKRAERDRIGEHGN